MWYHTMMKGLPQKQRERVDLDSYESKTHVEPYNDGNISLRKQCR